MGSLHLCHRFTGDIDISSWQGIWHVMCSARIGFLSLISFFPFIQTPQQDESLLGMIKDVLLGLSGSLFPTNATTQIPTRTMAFALSCTESCSLKPVFFCLLFLFLSLLLTPLFFFAPNFFKEGCMKNRNCSQVGEKRDEWGGSS